MFKPNIFLNGEERSFIITQIGARKDYFKQELKESAAQDDMKRVKQCINAIELIDGIINKLLGV